ncbi:unnamed protein product [Calypogeia fissa]
MGRLKDTEGDGANHQHHHAQVSYLCALHSPHGVTSGAAPEANDTTRKEEMGAWQSVGAAVQPSGASQQRRAPSPRSSDIPSARHSSCKRGQRRLQLPQGQTPTKPRAPF